MKWWRIVRLSRIRRHPVRSLAAQNYVNMRPVAANPAEIVDEVDFDVDGGYGDDGSGVRAFLTLEGDFVSTCEAYLADENASGLTLRIERNVAEQLVQKITPYLWP